MTDKEEYNISELICYRMEENEPDTEEDLVQLLEVNHGLTKHSPGNQGGLNEPYQVKSKGQFNSKQPRVSKP